MTDEPAPDDLPPRIVAVAYLLAAVCFVVPLAVIGAVFAGALLISRRRFEAGAGVIALAVICTVLGRVLLL